DGRAPRHPRLRRPRGRADRALLQVLRTRRAGRQHHRQPGRAVVRRRNLAGPARPPQGARPRATGRTAGRRRRHGVGQRAPQPAAQPGCCPGAAGPAAPRGGGPTSAAATADPPDAGLQGAAVGAEEAAQRHQARPPGTVRV
ncbi:MAG: Hypothetical protein YaeJ with similarity to translation release factor, partial [uncultured Nocardioidaceae bacterium]